MTPEKSSIDKKVSSAASKIMARAGQGLIGFKRDSQKSEKSNTSAGSGDHRLHGVRSRLLVHMGLDVHEHPVCVLRDLRRASKF